MNINDMINQYKKLNFDNPGITGLGFNKEIIDSLKVTPEFKLSDTKGDTAPMLLAGMDVKEVNHIAPHQMIVYYEGGDYAVYDLNKRTMSSKFTNPFKTDIQVFSEQMQIRKYC